MGDWVCIKMDLRGVGCEGLEWIHMDADEPEKGT